MRKQVNYVYLKHLFVIEVKHGTVIGLHVTKDIYKKIDWQKLLASKELSEDELEGEVYDFEVVDFGYDRGN